MATCESPSGLIVSFPVSDDWPPYIGPEADYYHDYVVPVHGLGDPSRILNGLINNPTPGVDFCATASGTLNDSRIGPVKSFVVTDRKSGADVVINVTQPGHAFHPGYVARSVSSSAGGVTVTNEGEGQAVSQSFDLLVDPAAQVLWGRLTQGIFDRGGDALRCGCGEP